MERPRRSAQQEQFLARLSAVGARIAPEYRYTRVVNGFSARLDPTSLSLLDDDREVTGIFPVRIAYPAQAAERRAACSPPRSRTSRSPGSTAPASRSRCSTPASTRPTRTSGGASSPASTSSNPGSGGIAQPHPTIPGRPERHATELAGIIAGTEGPDGLHGIAPGASILPVRVGGWQPNAEGGYSVYSRTDQILAGLEAAVDPERRRRRARRRPDRAHRHGRAVRRRSRTGRCRAGSPGRRSSTCSTIVPAGNDGSAGPGVRQHRRPGRRGGRAHRRGRGRPTRGADGSRAAFAPGFACSTRTTSRSAARRPRR